MRSDGFAVETINVGVLVAECPSNARQEELPSL